jgi:hypothetical protein
MTIETLFSDLIAAVKDNTIAVKDHTVALQALTAAQAAQAAPASRSKKTTASPQEVSPAPAPVAAPAPPAAPVAAPATAPAAPVSTDSLDKQLRAAVVALADTHPTKGHEKVKAILAGFKVERVSFLKPEQVPEALQQVQAALAEAAKAPSAASLI